MAVGARTSRLTAQCRLAGQTESGPNGVAPQSSAAISPPISPPPARKAGTASRGREDGG